MPRAFSNNEREQVRERLRRAAAERVAVVGYRRTTVGELARAAGISKGAFYGFYETKEQLFVEVLQRTEAQLRERLEVAAGQSGSRVEVLRGVIDQLRSAVVEHPLLRVIADPEESAVLFRHLPPAFLDEARADDDRWFAALFSGLADRGIVDEADVPVLVAVPRLMFVVAQGRSWLADDFDAVSRLLVDALAHHLGGTS